jgi:D-xylose transport system substrate-binding protein
VSLQGSSRHYLTAALDDIELFDPGHALVPAWRFKSGRWTDVSNPAGTWTPAVALSEFIKQYKAHPGINAALTPDDVISGPIISYLRGKKSRPRRSR